MSGLSGSARVLAAAVTIAVAVLGAATAAAAPATTRARPAAVKLAAAAGGSTDKCTDGFGGVIIASGLPPAPCLTYPGQGVNRWGDSVLPFDPVTQVVPKAKIKFNFPPLLIRGFVLVCFNSATGDQVCPFDTHLPDFKTFPYNFFGYYGSLWVQSPLGTEPKYGVFPPVQVSTLAFGSIPVTATVNVEQVVDANGYRKSLNLLWVSGSNLKGNITIPGYEQYGRPPKGGLYQFYGPPDIKGEVNVRLSNVRVDGVPVDVGPSCQTQTQLDLTAAAGYQLTGKPPIEGQPGEYTPQGNSYLHGSLDIPAFHGCRNGNEDLDPLITGMVSGTGNHIDAHQTTNLNYSGCYVKPNDPDCVHYHPPVIPPGKVLTPKLQAALERTTNAR